MRAHNVWGDASLSRLLESARFLHKSRSIGWLLALVSLVRRARGEPLAGQEPLLAGCELPDTTCHCPHRGSVDRRGARYVAALQLPEKHRCLQVLALGFGVCRPAAEECETPMLLAQARPKAGECLLSFGVPLVGISSPMSTLVGDRPARKWTFATDRHGSEADEDSVSNRPRIQPIDPTHCR